MSTHTVLSEDEFLRQYGGLERCGSGYTLRGYDPNDDFLIECAIASRTLWSVLAPMSGTYAYVNRMDADAWYCIVSRRPYTDNALRVGFDRREVCKVCAGGTPIPISPMQAWCDNCGRISIR